MNLDPINPQPSRLRPRAKHPLTRQRHIDNPGGLFTITESRTLVTSGRSVEYSDRDLGGRATQTLMDRLRQYVLTPVERIIDLGAGTGRFTTALCQAFNAEVIGFEPAANMRQRAEAKPHPPLVRFLEGSAERVPIAAEPAEGGSRGRPA